MRYIAEGTLSVAVSHEAEADDPREVARAYFKKFGRLPEGVISVPDDAGDEDDEDEIEEYIVSEMCEFCEKIIFNDEEYFMSEDDCPVCAACLKEFESEPASQQEETDAASTRKPFVCSMCAAEFEDATAGAVGGGATGHGGYQRCFEKLNGVRCGGKIMPRSEVR